MEQDYQVIEENGLYGIARNGRIVMHELDRLLAEEVAAELNEDDERSDHD